VHHEAGKEKTRDLYGILDGKPEGRKLFGKTRLKRKDNIKMSFEIRYVVIYVRMLTGLMWLRIKSRGRLLRTG
jgi:hypothetical protein